MPTQRERVPVRAIAVTIGMVLATAAILLLGWEVRRVLTWIVVAALLSIILGPVTDLVERRLHLRRSLATLLVFLLGFVLLVGVVTVFVRPIAKEGPQFIDRAPAYVAEAEAGKGPVGSLIKRYKLGLPFGLRFDHEMNGFWYPWSEQANGNQAGEFARAWRHVHDRFTAAGATNIIWIWSPNGIGALKNVSLPELYPGSDYVDWLGLGGYYRKPIPNKPATFTNTFGESLAALRAVDDKPIMLTEVGCTETGGNKPAWIRSMFQALSEQDDIIGFSWFNQTVTAIPVGQKLPVTNDWRIDSTPQSLAAFRAGIAHPRYGSGKPAQ